MDQEQRAVKQNAGLQHKYIHRLSGGDNKYVKCNVLQTEDKLLQYMYYNNCIF